jgi:hypothetical protein
MPLNRKKQRRSGDKGQDGFKYSHMVGGECPWAIYLYSLVIESTELELEVACDVGREAVSARYKKRLASLNL